MKRVFITITTVDSNPSSMDSSTYDDAQTIIEDGIAKEFNSRWRDKWGHNISSDVDSTTIQIPSSKLEDINSILSEYEK